MSLALAAKHLESQGRNKDSKLVHMTPDELKALNKLSLDHVGKPLSTNPKTGLPEAGFLSSLLPTVAGIAGAAMFPGVSPWLIAGGVGLAATALTGDIGQATGFATILHILLSVDYYLHERIWLKIKWGINGH